MQRKRGELVPIGEAFGGLDGPVKALRETSPQARRVFTQADQVHQLVGASEADPEPKHRELGPKQAHSEWTTGRMAAVKLEA